MRKLHTSSTSSFSLFPSSFRKGSALLIVLGMLSFMVVSAVGFSMYMRTSRAPSSYLRRNVAARYLVRAALAKAIEDLEGEFNGDKDWGKSSADEADTPRKFYGIYDDPFPGVVLNDTTARTDPNQNGDYWLGRVFTPFGPVRSTDATVSTLSLEALSYLPPAIIDDVRRLSRLTRTASWRSLPYDAGRYAYCAVNVSDLFDINRLRANVPRNSGKDRVTLASLCPKNFDNIMDLDTGMATSLDTILDKVDNTGNLYGNPVPFISLADFNFLAGNGSDYAPFMSFIGSGQNGPLASKKSSSATANALFITDTWFPPADIAEGETVYDLGSNAQPFNNYNATCFGDIGSDSKGVLNMNGNIGKVYEQNLGIGLVSLYDYLDSDNKPSSLALPTVEAVPMVVGVSCPAGLQPEVGEIDQQEVEVQNIRGTAVAVGDTEGTPVPVDNLVVKRKIKKFGITSFGPRASVKVVVTSPFKRLATTNRARSYSLRGLMRVWLAPNGMGCRPEIDENIYPIGVNSWINGVVNNGVATFLSDTKTLSAFSGDVKSTDEAVAEETLTFSNLATDNKIPIYYQIEEPTPEPPSGYKQPVVPDPSNYKASYKSLGNLKTLPAALRPLATDGSVIDTWNRLAERAQFNTSARYPGGPTELTDDDLKSLGPYRLYAAVWVQVMDGNQVVDMAPACIKDDVEWLSASDTLLDLGPAVKKAGSGAPILNFKGQTDISYTDIETALQQPVTYDGWKALYAVDPRYNFAPEDWFSSSASDSASKSEWMQLLGLNGTSSTILGQGGRDHDIFMFVSDQEYLQSIGELQFLPFLEDMNGTGNQNFLSGTYSPDFHGKPFSDRTGPNTGIFANGGRFWKTYSAYPVGGVNNTNLRNPYDMRYDGKMVTVLSGTGGFKLNPFSRDDRVIGAALIGTPFDYYVASTNSNQTQSGGRRNNLVDNMSLSQMMDTYSFGDKSSLAKLSKEELFDIAGEIKETFEESANKGDADWLSAWDDLMWQENVASKVNDENKTFMATDITLQEPLHGVDRKYLYSFWRDCFDNRQQLFLIFVRAEPTSVGGGSLSRASTQLGGRAVALVWRDPAKPERNVASRPVRTTLNSIDSWLNARKDFPPHKTRVLFYHQFD